MTSSPAETCPQIRSTQTTGVPDCVLGSFVFVAHGIVIQSVEHCEIMIILISTRFDTEVPTTLPRAGEPPVTENDCAGLLAGDEKTC